MKSRKRINWIVKLQSFAILLVIVGHSFPVQNINEYPQGIVWIHHFIYLFHMPLFMFFSGYLFIITNADRDIEYRKFVKKKAIRLLVPYFILSTIAYIIKSFLTEYSRRPLQPSIANYIKVMLYPTDNPIILFWFLPTLFILFLFAPFMKKVLTKNNILVSISIIVLLMAVNVFYPSRVKPLNLAGVLHYMVYFFSGGIAGYYFRGRLYNLGRWYLVLALLLCMIAVNTYTMKHELSLYRLLAAFNGIMFAISLACFIDRSNLGIFKSYDGYSYQIFLLSWFPQVFFWILYRLNIINSYLTVGLMLIGGLYIPVIAARIVEKRFKKLYIVIGLN